MQAEVLQVHGFYADKRKKEVYFDLVLDFGVEVEEVKREIIGKMKKKYGGYGFNVIIDSNVSVL